MIKFDYHTHSAFSSDSPAPMADMVSAAYKAGFSDIAVTDHIDPDYASPDDDFDLDHEAYHAEISRLQDEYGGRIRVVRGLEVGMQTHVLSDCKKAVEAYPYDFIIASVHCAEKQELYGSRFFRDRSLKDAYQTYYRYLYDCLRAYKNYSVVGHLNIVERYADEVLDDSYYMDIIEEILKLIISDGKGIELNLSSFRYNMRNTMPSADMLKRYRELGGEIITVGSDAHRPQYIGDHFPFAEDLLKRTGFRYVTVFDQMRPRMERID